MNKLFLPKSPATLFLTSDFKPYFYFMKVFTILIAILSFWLSTQPCCAEEVGDKEIAIAHINDSPSNHPCGDKLPCSPFYSCRGCVGFSIEKFTIPFYERLNEVAITHFTFWHEIHSEAFLSGLIKPPGSYLV
jgi:hypothetical protein